MTMATKLNVNLFFEGLARALTAQFEKQCPGIEITVKSIKRKDDGNADGDIQRQNLIEEHAG